MIELGPCEITGVFGPMASGKTFLMEQWLKRLPRYVRFDVTGESVDMEGVEHIYASPRALWERLKANPYLFRIAYHPGPNMEEDFELAVKCLWRVRTYKTLVCDEFHEVCPNGSTPGYVKTLMRYARHAHLALVGASQRIADVDKLFTSGARQTVIFWSQEARDYDAVANRWGTDAADMMRNLRPLIFDDVKRKTLQIPQALVCPKSGSPRIFDFAKDDYVSAVAAPASGTDVDEVPSEADQIRDDPSEGSGELGRDAIPNDGSGVAE